MMTTDELNYQVIARFDKGFKCVIGSNRCFSTKTQTNFNGLSMDRICVRAHITWGRGRWRESARFSKNCNVMNDESEESQSQTNENIMNRSM